MDFSASPYVHECSSDIATFAVEIRFVSLISVDSGSLAIGLSALNPHPYLRPSLGGDV